MKAKPVLKTTVARLLDLSSDDPILVEFRRYIRPGLPTTVTMRVDGLKIASASGPFEALEAPALAAWIQAQFAVELGKLASRARTRIVQERLSLRKDADLRAVVEDTDAAAVEVSLRAPVEDLQAVLRALGYRFVQGKKAADSTLYILSKA